MFWKSDDAEGEDAGVEEASADSAVESAQNEIESALGEDQPAPGAPGESPGERPATADELEAADEIQVRWKPADIEPGISLTWKMSWQMYGRYGEGIEGFEFPDELADQVGEDLAEDLAPILDELLPRHATKAKYANFSVKLINYVAASAAAVHTAKELQEQKESGDPTKEEGESS